MSWQRMVNAGLNAFGLMAFLKSLDRAEVKRFAEALPSPTEGCKGKSWVVRLERDDAEAFRVKGVGNRAVKGKEGRLMGTPVEVAGVQWAPVVWDGSLMPTFVQAEHLEPVE